MPGDVAQRDRWPARPITTDHRTVGDIEVRGRGLLLGFSGLRVAVIAAGIAVFVAAMFAAGLPGVVGTCLLQPGLGRFP